VPIDECGGYGRARIALIHMRFRSPDCRSSYIRSSAFGLYAREGGLTMFGPGKRRPRGTPGPDDQSRLFRMCCLARLHVSGEARCIRIDHPVSCKFRFAAVFLQREIRVIISILSGWLLKLQATPISIVSFAFQRFNLICIVFACIVGSKEIDV
jgi:hypothetical protein